MVKHSVLLLISVSRWLHPQHISEAAIWSRGLRMLLL